MRLKNIVVGFWLVVAWFFLAGRLAWARQWPAQPQGYVSDYAQIFTPTYRQELETKLQALKAETSVELAVVTIDSLEGDSIEQAATELFETWQLGKKGKDNGLLLLITFGDRQVRIEAGYGLEPVITDGRAGRIIREKIAPEFKRNNYEDGVEAGVDEIAKYLAAGEPATEVVKAQAERFFPLVIFGFIWLVYAAAFLGRSERIWPGGILGLFLGLVLGLVAGAVIWLVFWPILMGFLGLLLDWLFSRNYRRRAKEGKPTGFWPSWGGFSSGSSSGSGRSGGFGGFGGGGSSGGGGASGSW